MSEPTADQRFLLNAIWLAYRREGRWPSYRGIDQVLDRQGLPLRPLIESMPPGLMLPDPQLMSQVRFPSDGDQCRVQIAGLAYCEDTDADLTLIARLVRYLADRERSYVMPSLSDPEPLRVSSEEAKRDLGLSDDEVVRSLSLLTTFEPRVLNSGSHSSEAWNFEIDVDEIRRYRDVETAEDYLAARREADRPRIAALPFAEPTVTPTTETATNEDTAQSATVPTGATMAMSRSRHAIFTTVVGTVVGGLVLAAILWAIHLI